jgi:hypothetical protein
MINGWQPMDSYDYVACPKVWCAGFAPAHEFRKEPHAYSVMVKWDPKAGMWLDFEMIEGPNHHTRDDFQAWRPFEDPGPPFADWAPYWGDWYA